MEHVVTVVLKQPKDGPLAKALDRGGSAKFLIFLLLASLTMMISGMCEMMVLRGLLSIGHKGMLKTLKLFTAYNMAEAHPIDDWTQVTKKDFDDFRVQ